MIVFEIIFWSSLLLIVHSYLLFPWLLQLLSLRKEENQDRFSPGKLPPVTVVMSVFNEEMILARKLDSILQSDYPADKLTLRIGSDASTDRTNEILNDYSSRYGNIIPLFSEVRSGKPSMINRLVSVSEDEIIVMTDAKVLFETDTISGLAGHFRNPEIGAVGGNILNRSIRRDGVSIQESAFMSREILMKYREGLIWGATIGIYGAIYALRKSVYTPVPEGFSVDDFFISMNVLRKPKRVILDINVVTYEEVPNRLTEEYRRKVRIATGNYQNLGYFARELLTPWKGASFAYWSHKVIRWLGPFILGLILLSNILLFRQHPVYEISLFTLAGLLLLPIIDYFLSKLGIHIVFLRFVRHFVTMNVALLHGFINNLRGIRKHVWQPTER